MKTILILLVVLAGFASAAPFKLMPGTSWTTGPVADANTVYAERFAVKVELL